MTADRGTGLDLDLERGPGPVLDPGTDAVKLTSYFGERSRSGGRLAADALLEAYERHQVPVSVLLRGAEGFGARRHPRTDASLSLSQDLPLIAVAVDRRERIEPLAEEAARLCGAGLVTMTPVRIAVGPARPGDRPPGAGSGEVKLTVYLGRSERAGRVPGYVAAVDLLRRGGIAGATALLGVDGTRHGRRERAAFFSRNTGTPAMVIAVGDAERVAAVLPELTGLPGRPLLTLEPVRICKRDGALLSPPPSPGPARDPAPRWPSADPVTGGSGPPPWQQLTVCTSESARHDGEPVPRAIVRRLRAAGLAGATTTRGLWGFHGDHAPHGDRLLQLGRRVPAVTVVIDAPGRIADAFAIIDELTADQGLVTCATVPALRAE